MNSFKNIAYQILKETGKPLHSNEITKIALNKKLIKTSGKTPEKTMNTQILLDIKYKGKRSLFFKAGPSTYNINNKIILDKIKTKGQQGIKSGYTGNAGEYLVCSELLFRGFNASIMNVDEGIDIVACKENKTFFIQVKTANALDYGRGNNYVFDIKVSSFERHNFSNVFYIFVLRSADFFTENEGEKEDRYCIILPYFELEKFINNGIIKKVGEDKRYRVNTKIREGIFFGNLNNNVDYYVNNWNILK